jgi:hypothetical protein
VAARETEKGAEPHEATFDATGSVRFRGVRRDASYAIWVPPERAGDPCGYATGRRASSDPVVVRLGPSRTLEGRLRGGGAISEGQVFLHAPAIHVGEGVADDGTFRVTGLPDADFRLFATAWIDGENWVGHAQAAVGTRIEVSLERVADR